MPSDTTSSLTYSGDATSTVKGYNGSFNQWGDHGYLDASGVSNSGYLQHAVSYGTEATPSCSWGSTYVADATNGTTAVHGRVKSALGSNVPVNKKGFNNSIKTNNTSDNKYSNLGPNMKSRQYTASPNFSKSLLQTQPQKPLNQLGGYQSAGLSKGFQPVGKFSSYTSRNQGLFAHNTPLNYRPYARVWNGNDRFQLREKSNRHGDFEATTELTRGPRGHSKGNPLNSSAEDEQMGLPIRRDQYNLEDFEIEYDNAKFYVIKSYSEDDIHKCIKYNVWSSTPNGNKKLDAAFSDAEAKTCEAGIKCPIILFYSVNGSGQFLGLAEMVARVDFGKSMDFWQLDKWNGFFPVKWHIIKDIPNTQLRHIIVENNDDRPVTYTRDTQEIGLKQGLEMLKIFKTYSGKTSMLDDFNFYENREALLKGKRRGKRSSKPTAPTEIYRKHDAPKHLKARERIIEDGSDTSNNISYPTSSLANLTRNLSLNSPPLESGAVMN